MAAQELEKLRRETWEREVWRRRRPERRHEWMEHGLALCDFSEYTSDEENENPWD
jgi:hypothetical protein